jgi:hypothetical protein
MIMSYIHCLCVSCGELSHFGDKTLNTCASSNPPNGDVDSTSLLRCGVV